jgi:GT2 family glycosyltransferase
MPEKLSLSIILTFHNNRDVIESTLSSVFELKQLAYELIIIDDASTDGSSDAIKSLLDYYDHERTFFFQHEKPAGRGNCLNEALQQCNSNLVWCPSSIEQIDESQLVQIPARAKENPQYCFIQQLQLPESGDEWLAYVARQSWHDDASFIWNLDAIPSGQHFFNPYQHQHHGLELAARLSSTGSVPFEQVERFSTISGRATPISPVSADKKELIYSLLRNPDLKPATRTRALKFYNEIPATDSGGSDDDFQNEQLAEAFRMKQEGRLGSALELVEQVLKHRPNHPEAKQLKIQILEKKRRFVEASELKHELLAEQNTAPDDADFKTSLIISTALYGKEVLEHCLIAVSEHCDPKTTKLIVIDNASLDDTHDYLDELEKKGFFSLKVITNSQNKGFAASVNQGLEAACGDYACVLHNDVVINSNAVDELERLMDENPRYAVVGPMANKTLNPDQSTRNEESYSNELVRAEYLDSFCMMVRLDTGLRMDEAYQLAFFEDIDFCFEARKEGHRVGIATGVSVEHHYGTTTFGLNLDTESEQYWKNVAYFNEKWGIEVYSEEELKSRSRFDQLLAIDQLVNPLYPEESLKSYFEELFTDELKTEMMQAKHDPDTLCSLVHLMMVMEERELMRRLEDRLDNVDLPTSLIYQLVRFYYYRNIYSRCRHYLDKLKAEQQSLQSELYKLQMMVGDKEFREAVPKLTELLEKAPTNPTLYKLAGDIHQFKGNQDEAESFYKIAAQINPFEYSETGETEFKIKS